jgi:hypothetical protein
VILKKTALFLLGKDFLKKYNRKNKWGKPGKNDQTMPSDS